MEYDFSTIEENYMTASAEMPRPLTLREQFITEASLSERNKEAECVARAEVQRDLASSDANVVRQAIHRSTKERLHIALVNLTPDELAERTEYAEKQAAGYATEAAILESWAGSIFDNQDSDAFRIIQSTGVLSEITPARMRLLEKEHAKQMTEIQALEAERAQLADEAYIAANWRTLDLSRAQESVRYHHGGPLTFETLITSVRASIENSLQVAMDTRDTQALVVKIVSTGVITPAQYVLWTNNRAVRLDDHHHSRAQKIEWGTIPLGTLQREVGNAAIKALQAAQFDSVGAITKKTEAEVAAVPDLSARGRKALARAIEGRGLAYAQDTR
jgi:hypothetical protein